MSLPAYSFTTEPILVAQVYGQLGGKANALDIRITDFEVDAETFVREGESPREHGLSKMWWAVLLIAGLTTVIALIWWYRHREV